MRWHLGQRGGRQRGEGLAAINVTFGKSEFPERKGNKVAFQNVTSQTAKSDQYDRDLREKKFWLSGKCLSGRNGPAREGWGPVWLEIPLRIRRFLQITNTKHWE